MSNTKKAAASAATNEAKAKSNGQPKKAPTRAEIEAQVLLQIEKLEALQSVRAKREIFTDVRAKLEEVEIDLERELSNGDLDRSDYQLRLQGGANLSLSITNPQILASFVEFIKPRIDAKIAEINAELLK